MARRLLAVVTILLGAACGYDGVPPSVLPPAREAEALTPAAVTLTIVPGVGVDTNKASLAASVTDVRGRPVQTAVTFSSTAGSVTPSVVRADAGGLAQALLTGVGIITVTATAGTASAQGAVVLRLPGSGTPVVNAPPTPPPDTTPAFSLTLVADTVTLGAVTIFKANLVGAVFPIQSAVWTFGDGTDLVNQTYSAQHTYAAAGNFSATVAVTDAQGRVARGSTIAVVSPQPSPTPTPTPTLSATLTCTAPAAVPGTATCNISTLIYGSVVVPIASVTSVTWDWGDGSTSTGAVGTRDYSNPGTYTIVAAITASTADGSKQATATKSLVVPKP